MNTLVSAVMGRAEAKGESTDAGQVESGLGLLFHELRERLAPNEFAEVAGHVPEAAGLADSAAARLESSGSGGGLSGMFGGLLGGGEAGDLMRVAAKARSLGLNISEATTLLPIALSVLETRLPAPLMAKVRSFIPGGGAPKKGGLLGGLFG